MQLKRAVAGLREEGFERKPYEQWVRPLGSFSLERKLRGELSSVCSFFMRARGGAAPLSSLWRPMTGPRVAAQIYRDAIAWILVKGVWVSMGTGWHSTSQHQPDRAQEEFGQHSQAHGGTLGLSSVVPGNGFDEPCEFLPTQCALWVSDSYSSPQPSSSAPRTSILCQTFKLHAQ